MSMNVCSIKLLINGNEYGIIIQTGVRGGDEI